METGGVIEVGQGKRVPSKEVFPRFWIVWNSNLYFYKEVVAKNKKEEEKKEDKETSFASSLLSNTITSLLMASLFSFILREDFESFFIVTSELLAKTRTYSKIFKPCKLKFSIHEHISWYANKLKYYQSRQHQYAIWKSFFEKYCFYNLFGEFKGDV